MHRATSYVSTKQKHSPICVSTDQNATLLESPPDDKNHTNVIYRVIYCSIILQRCEILMNNVENDSNLPETERVIQYLKVGLIKRPLMKLGLLSY